MQLRLADWLAAATVPLLQNLIKLFTPRTWNTSQTWPLIRAQKLIINDIKLAQFTKLKSWGLIFHVLCQYVSSINWIKYFGSNSDTCFLQWLLSRALSDQFNEKKKLYVFIFPQSSKEPEWECIDVEQFLNTFNLKYLNGKLIVWKRNISTSS